MDQKRIDELVKKEHLLYIEILTDILRRKPTIKDLRELSRTVIKNEPNNSLLLFKEIPVGKIQRTYNKETKQISIELIPLTNVKNKNKNRKSK